VAKRDGWKINNPEEMLLETIREVRKWRVEKFQYTRLQGIRLESRLVGGERRLYMVVDDDTASNDGVEYQLAP